MFNKLAITRRLIVLHYNPKYRSFFTPVTRKSDHCRHEKLPPQKGTQARKFGK